MTDNATPPLTSRARIALAIARGIAASRGDDDVTPVHAALGILREGKNPAVGALLLAGLELGALREDLKVELGRLGHPRPRKTALPTTPGEDDLLSRAQSESRLRNDGYVGTEHILLAILRDRDAAAAQVLARRGLAFDTAATNLERVLQPPPEPPTTKPQQPAV